MSFYHNINGEFKQAEESVISVFDIGLLRGYGIFDFFPVMSGEPLFLDDYFARFYSSAEQMKLEPPLNQRQLKERIRLVIDQNNLQDGFIKLVLTGGSAADGYTPTTNNLLVLAHGPVQYPASLFETGARLILQRFQRSRPRIKSLNYANAILQRDVTTSLDAIDILYHDGRLVQETSRANFFLVDRNNVLRASKHDTLAGITRKHVIAVAKKLGIEVDLSPVPLSLIPQAKEAFITSTTKTLIPIHKINDHEIASGNQMPITNKLRSAYRIYVDQYLEQSALRASI